MTRHRHQRSQPPDGIEDWRMWIDHRYDPDYYARTGRVNPVLHAYVGFTLVVFGGLFVLGGIAMIFIATPTFGAQLEPLFSGGAMLAAGIALLRWDRRRRLKDYPPLKPRRRKRKARR